MTWPYYRTEKFGIGCRLYIDIEDDGVAVFFVEVADLIRRGGLGLLSDA